MTAPTASILVAARIALIAAVTAALGDDVTVSYSYQGKLDEANREYVHGGRESTEDIALSAMRGSGALKRETTATWSLFIRVSLPGEESCQAGDERAMELGAAIEAYVAANPTLAGAVAGLLKVTLPSFSLSSYPDDDGTHTVLTYTVAFQTFLS